MSRCTLRYLFTVLLYAGVAIVLVPYISGDTSKALIFLLGGIGVALVCGFLRCFLTDGNCTDRLDTPTPPPGAENQDHALKLH